jgi:hypothetical protein
MNKIKNPNYDKELKIYKKKSDSLNYKLANKKTYFKYNGQFFLKQKNVTPYQEYIECMEKFKHHCIPGSSYAIFCFISFIMLNLFTFKMMAINWTCLALMILPIIYIIVSVSELLFCKRT